MSFREAPKKRRGCQSSTPIGMRQNLRIAGFARGATFRYPLAVAPAG